MTKKDFTRLLSLQTGLTIDKTDQVIDSFLEIIQETVASGDSITFPNFGTFEVLTRKERRGCPPGGEVRVFPEKKFPKFKPGKGFSEMVAVS